MKIYLDNLYSDSNDTVSVCCYDRQGAIEDQSIRGCRWEAPGDMDCAYAIISDEPGLVEKLEADGYEVDDSDYVSRDD